MSTTTRRSEEQLAAFIDIAKALTSTLELNEILDLIGDRLSHLLGAERWSLVLQGDDGLLHFAVARGPGAERLKDEVMVVGEGIAGVTFSTGKARLVADVRADPDFAPRFDVATLQRTCSALAVPLMVRGRTLGVLELVHSVDGPIFTEEDLRAASAVSDFAAIAIDNAKNFRATQELSRIDEHTGVFNVRHLRAEVEREVARCRRFGRPMSLLFLDIDHFKAVNDTRGHLAGSLALKLAAQLLQDQVRAVDFVFRYGGDEFAVLLVETGPDGARIAAERMVEAFRASGLDVGRGAALRLTISVGWASFPDHGQSTASLLQAADAAMYRAKNNGRDRAAGV
jgi:diguanylate cyclase (GGDEF)-like protein